MVLGIESILAIPAELVLAHGTLHELAAATPLNETFTAWAHLTPNHLVEVTEHAHFFVLDYIEFCHYALEVSILLKIYFLGLGGSTPSVTTLSAFEVLCASIFNEEAV